MNERPPVRATARTLTLGTVASSALLLSGLIAAAAGFAEPSRLLSLGGVVVLLATPAAGLAISAIELRPIQPRAALLALVVLGVLAVAAAVAAITR